MPESTEPIGAPRLRVTEKREYQGPVGWSLPQRARELAVVLFVELVDVKVSVRPAGRLERVTVEVCGDWKKVNRFWRRLDEVADAGGQTDGAGRATVRAGGRWSLRALLDSILSGS
ncbi:hypothetical protein C7Y72_01310 [Paraconexibacter algicola]|uniref:Uncharacterized protein n=1 Tax=Paraconexibacter algicola TaxID=2133960 RepID=A0A2T4UGJ7_9ACTN|nr:hypothetical protein C7Y72_01310 [Paraconexibacter algicola]